MIKKWLGIRKIEEVMKRFHSDTNNHWGHTQNLYRLNEENKREIAELRQNLDMKTDRLLNFMNGLIEKMDSAEDKDVREIVPERPRTIDIKQEEFPDTDVVLLQIMHQNAALDTPNAVTTAQIYDNLPFPITKRGLRKKLESLSKQGVLMTFKRANERDLHISTGKLSAVKQAIKAKSAKEQDKE